MNNNSWKNTVSTISVALSLYIIAGFVINICDAISFSGLDILSNLMELAMAFESGNFFQGPDVLDIVEALAKIVLIVGYIILLGSLNDFRELQKISKDKDAVKQIRSGYIIFVFAALLDFIPALGGLLALILYIIGYAKQISGYRLLSQSEVMPPRARESFDTLRSCVIWSVVGCVVGIVPLVGDIIECFIVLAVFISMLSSWSLIKGNAPTGTLQVLTDIKGGNPQTVCDHENIRLYDTTKLEDIVRNGEIYNAALVNRCKEELEVRLKSKSLEEKVRTYDDAKLQEIISNPSIYSSELVFCCERKKAERDTQKRELEIKLAEERRVLHEQQERQRMEKQAEWWEKWRFVVIGSICFVILSIFFICRYFVEQERIKKEERIRLELLEAQRIETERLEKIRLEEERKKAEVEAKRKAEAKRREEARIIAEREKLNAEKEKQRQIEGPFEIGEYHAPTNGVIICLDDTKKHGVVMTLNFMGGMDKDWQQMLAYEGWRFPIKEEVEEIWRNMEIINKTIEKKSIPYNMYRKRRPGYTNNVAFYTDKGVAYDYNGESSGVDGYTRLVKNF